MRSPWKRKSTLGTPSTSTNSTTTLSPTPPSSSRSLPPGDNPPPVNRAVQPSEVRELNELIRKRYALDMEIWALRNCRARDRHLVMEKMAKSTAALAKIVMIVKTWDCREAWESDKDWERLKMIRQRIERDGYKRDWDGNPPWED